MEQIAVLMICLGAFTFLGGGLSAANSIEAQENKTTANILGLITFIGALSFLAGFIVLIISAFI